MASRDARLGRSDSPRGNARPVTKARLEKVLFSAKGVRRGSAWRTSDSIREAEHLAVVSLCDAAAEFFWSECGVDRR